MLPGSCFALKQDGWLHLHMRTAARPGAVPSRLLSLGAGIARLWQMGGTGSFHVLMQRRFLPGVSVASGLRAVMGEAEKFHYIYSCDLDINVQLKM